MRSRKRINIGDKLYCNSGHLICEAVKEINSFQSLKCSYFKFVGHQPRPGEKIKQCNCGDVWIKGTIPTNINNSSPSII